MVTKRQRKEKAGENRTKESLRIRERTLVEQTALLASPIYVRQAQWEETKHIKRDKAYKKPLFLGWPALIP